MKRSLFILVSMLIVPFAAAQQSPHIGYVYPAGGQLGRIVEVTIGGQRLAGVSAARVSGDGVEAKVVEHIMPLTPVQALILRDQLKELIDHKAIAATRPATTRPWTAAEEDKVADIRSKLAAYQPRPASPAIAESVKLQLTISHAAQPGERAIRLLTANGLTNPMLFEVGRLEEFSKKSAVPNSRGSQEVSVTLPAVINGQIMPGQVDRFRFAARKGDHLVAIVAARKLVPYLADAVPGWFQATLAVYDSRGKELAYSDDFRFQPDPILHYLIPADGDYVVAIRDSIYRGREDFVYRIALGELPFVTNMFPLGGKAGERTPVELRGWNLASYRTIMDATALETGVHALSATKRAGMCNSPAFAVDDLPECLEREPNNSPSTPHAVTTPIIVNGRIDRPGDYDVYLIEAGADETIVAEVNARRLGSSLDSVLRLTDASGNSIATNDDWEDKGSGLNTHHADSLLTVTLPAAGRYFIHLADVQQQGGLEYGYRLRISRSRPDFALRVVPSSINIRRGASAAVTVFALRKDGFAGSIDLSLQDAPAGLKLAGAKILKGQESAKVTITAPSRPLEGPLPLSLHGKAIIEGRSIVRRAVPADEMMQAFIYRHLVCADELLLATPSRRISR